MTLGKDGAVTDVQWDGPAFKAGLDIGAQVVAIDGDAYDVDLMKERIRNAVSDQQPIRLLVKDDDAYRTVSIDYHGGLRYPRLERIAGTPALLDDILAAKE